MKYYTEEKQERIKELLNENKVAEVEIKNNVIEIRLDNGKEISIGTSNGSEIDVDIFKVD